MLFVLVAFVLPLLVIGQTDYQDVVYLKNGSIIRGMIIEQIPNVSLKIQTSDNSVFAYTIDEIEKITKEKKTIEEKNKTELKIFKQSNKKEKDTIKYELKPFSDILETSLFPYFNISNIAGFNFFNHYYFGLGAGISFIGNRIYDFDNSIGYFTFFSDHRIYLTRQHKVTPAIFGDIGYNFGIAEKEYIAESNYNSSTGEYEYVYANYLPKGLLLRYGTELKINFNPNRGSNSFNICLGFTNYYLKELYISYYGNGGCVSFPTLRVHHFSPFMSFGLQF